MPITLADWLAYIPPLHIIQPGLARCREVAARLGVLPPNYFSIIVAGTNGKGSSVALLDAILRAAGVRCGCFTSPHLLRYNERVMINGNPVSDDVLCEAFACVEKARRDIFISNFEFSALVALVIFQQAKLDVGILEVGLGGRLDATNIVDADAALLTPIDLDHREWLGDTRNAIGTEKAGVLRNGQTAACSDLNPPNSVLHRAQQLGVRLYVAGRDFHWRDQETGWHWQMGNSALDLTYPNLAGEHQLQNAAGVLALIQAMQNSASPGPESTQDKKKIESKIARAHITEGLHVATLPGRWQRLPARVPVYLDVAHNPHGMQAVARNMKSHGDNWHVLLAMQKDKDSLNSIAMLKPYVKHWHVCPLPPPRGATAAELAQYLPHQTIKQYSAVTAAYQQLVATLPADAQLLVVGSFATVTEVLQSSLGGRS